MSLESVLAHLDPAEGEGTSAFISAQDVKDALTELASMMLVVGSTPPEVTGQRESSAMTSLLSVLEQLGIITDSTEAMPE